MNKNSAATTPLPPFNGYLWLECEWKSWTECRLFADSLVPLVFMFLDYLCDWQQIERFILVIGYWDWWQLHLVSDLYLYWISYHLTWLTVRLTVLWRCWLGGRKGIRPVERMGGWWRWALVSPDGVVPSRMIFVSASVNPPLHHKVQKFSSGTGSPGWSRKKGP